MAVLGGESPIVQSWRMQDCNAGCVYTSIVVSDKLEPRPDVQGE